MELLEERAERVGGAALVGMQAFDAFVWVLDNIARIDLLVRLHDYLPSFILNPVTSFVCMCVGGWLIHLSHRKQLQRVSSPRLLDSSGAKYQRNEKVKWLLPVLTSFSVALGATLILAVGYSLAYEGAPPKNPIAPLPPISAYTKTEKAVPRALEGPKIEQHTEGSNSPAVVGNNNQFTYSAEPANRFLTARQQEAIEKRLSSVPPGAFWIVIDSVNYDVGSEQVIFGGQLSSILQAAHWTKLEKGDVGLPVYNLYNMRGLTIAAPSSLLASADALSKALVPYLIRSNVRSLDLSTINRTKFTGDFIEIIVGVE